MKFNHVRITLGLTFSKCLFRYKNPCSDQMARYDQYYLISSQSYLWKKSTLSVIFSTISKNNFLSYSPNNRSLLIGQDDRTILEQVCLKLILDTASADLTTYPVFDALLHQVYELQWCKQSFSIPLHISPPRLQCKLFYSQLQVLIHIFQNCSHRNSVYQPGLQGTQNLAKADMITNQMYIRLLWNGID